MWGGVKARRQYGEHFRQWSATKGLDELRRVLYQEPRPWFLAFSLHQRRHLLQDHHCARLISWCTTVVQLRPSCDGKQEAYRYAQETFGMLTHSHRVGKEALLEYMRLCAVGRDLTSAYNWHKYWLDTKSSPQGSRNGSSDAGTDGLGLLQQYAWLLRIALESPSEESAEDMALAVKEGYSDRCCVAMEHEATGERVLAHFQPTNPEEEAALQGLFCAFRALEQRLSLTETTPSVMSDKAEEEEDLRSFIRSLPVTQAEAQEWLNRGWPTRSHCQNFPHLEKGVRVVEEPTFVRPRLCNSLLSSRLVEKLERAAFAERNVSAVIAILKWYQECVKLEQSKADSGTRRLHQQKLDGELIDVWAQFADATAQHFRAAVVEAGGLTPELYHYVVCALAQSQPSAALRTLQRMRESNLRVLDLTRAVALVAAEGSFADQLHLFNEQLAEMAERRRLDDDFDITKSVEVYWKYEYTDFFHYMNAMDEEAFYGFLMNGLGKADGGGGPQAVQKLLLASGRWGPTATEEDLVVLDDALRGSVARHLRHRLGSTEVDTAMDLITNHMPKLDISLVGSLPHFQDYTLSHDDEIATDVAALAAKLRPYDTLYVLDASFVETSEAFLSLGHHRGASEGKSLVLIPYVTLAQLGASIANGNKLVSFDSALAETIKAEPFLASQRLRSLSALAQRARESHGEGAGADHDQATDVRLLHFTECLLAHRLPHETITRDLALFPATSDNDHLILVLALLTSVIKPGARVILCSDDEAMVSRMAAHASEAGKRERHDDHQQPVSKAGQPCAMVELFSAPIEVLRTQSPMSVNVKSGLIDDNPTLDFNEVNFVPKLDVSKAIKGSVSAKEHPSANAQETRTTTDADHHVPSSNEGDHNDAQDSEATAIRSPWLSLLDEDENVEVPEVPSGSLLSSARVSPVDGDADAWSTPHQMALTPEVSGSRVGSAEHATEVPEVDRAGKEEELMKLFMNPYDVVPVGVKMREASALGSVFSQFDVVEPEEAERQEQDRQARHSQLQQQGEGRAGKQRRRSLLERDMLAHRGASYKERKQLARQLSNMSGGRVPFHFRYRVVEADLRDPRNAKLSRKLEEGIRKSRELYRKKHG